jgi:hypothetical protein
MPRHESKLLGWALRAGQYIQASQTVNDATQQYLLDLGAIATGDEAIQELNDARSKIKTALDIYVELHSGDLLGASADIIGDISQILLKVAFELAAKSPKGAAIAAEAATITADTFTVAGAIFTSYMLGFIGAPNS